MKGNRKAQKERGVGRLKDHLCKHIRKRTGKCELNINYFILP